MNAPEVTLTPPVLALTPDRPYVGRLVVRNTGPEVEEFTLEALGPLAEWVRLSEPQLRTWPGETREATVTVAIPPGPHPVAGAATLRVASRTLDGACGFADVVVDIAPRFDVVVHGPAPHAITTTRRALVHATVVNRGNTVLPVRVTARDAAGRVQDEAGSAGRDLVLRPGEAVTLPLVLRSAKVAWLGKPARCDYAVQAASEPVTAAANGVITFEAILSTWWVLLVPAIAVLYSRGEALRVLALVVALGVLVAVVLRLRRLVRAGAAATWPGPPVPGAAPPGPGPHG